MMRESDWIEFRPDDKGKFDELVARFADGLVHVETMSPGSVYIGLTWDDGRICQLWISSGKPLSFHHEQGKDKPPRFNAAGQEQAA